MKLLTGGNTPVKFGAFVTSVVVGFNALSINGVAQQSLPTRLTTVMPMFQQATPQTPAAPKAGGEGAGSTIFGNYCESCHGNPKVPEAPPPAMLRKMTPEKIYFTLSQGEMKPMAKDLTDQQQRDIAEWVGGKKLGAGENGDAKLMKNHCPTNPPITSLIDLPSWNGWTPDLSTTRMQTDSAAKLSPAAVTRLRLKWAFGLPAATSVYGQPTVVAGRVFVSADTGFIYSLNAQTGCVYWSFQAQAGVRSAMSVGPVKQGSTNFAVFFGDIRGNVYAIDANTGTLLWTVPIDPHPLSRITGSIRLYNDRLYIPVSSLEEPESSSPSYICCSFRGMIAALDANTGKQVWKTYTLPDVPTEQTTPDGKKIHRNRRCRSLGTNHH